MKLKVKAARLFLIALFAFGLYQIPLSVWESLWNWLLDMGRLMVLAK